MEDLYFNQRTTLPTRTPDVLDRNLALLQKAEGYAYKTTASGTDLGAYVFRPRSGTPPAGGWPVILFFYSSSWDNGLLSQFAPHALYFASRGIMGILIDYRTTGKFPGCTPMDAVSDARSAVRWVRENAAELGADPDKITGCGGSAGAHAILAAAMIPEGDDSADNLTLSCVPNALVLFSPILETGPGGVLPGHFTDRRQARRACLMSRVRRKLPPMLLIHGTGDRVVPCEHSVRFRRKNWWRRNVCELLTYEGYGHGFFNFNVDVRHYELTLNEFDKFLVARGFIEPNPDDDGVPRLS